MYFNPPVLSCYVSVSYIWNETLLYFSNKLLWYTWIKVQTVTFQSVNVCVVSTNQTRAKPGHVQVYVLGFNNNHCSPFGYTFTDIPFWICPFFLSKNLYRIAFSFFFKIYIFPSCIYRTATQSYRRLQKKPNKSKTISIKESVRGRGSDVRRKARVNKWVLW